MSILIDSLKRNERANRMMSFSCYLKHFSKILNIWYCIYIEISPLIFWNLSKLPNDWNFKHMYNLESLQEYRVQSKWALIF